MTLQEIVNEVRRLVNDMDTPYRYGDSDLVTMLNQVLQHILQLRPDLYSNIGDFTCVAGILQTLPSDGYRVMEVFGVKNGSAVTEVDRESMDLGVPAWRIAIPDTPVNWMRHPRAMKQFFVYPPAAGGETLVVEYAKSPATYSSANMNTVVAELGEPYFPTVVAGIIWLVESVDDEHVNSGRAQTFQQAFLGGLGMSQQAKVITDTEAGGVVAAAPQPPMGA